MERRPRPRPRLRRRLRLGRRPALVAAAIVALAVAQGVGVPAHAADWSDQKTSASKRLLDVAFANANSGVAVGQDGLIMATRDGGLTWAERSSPADVADLRTVSAVPNCGAGPCYWAGAANGSILVSTDGTGTNWCLQSTGVSEKINGIHVSAANPNDAVAVGTEGVILRASSARECGAAYSRIPSDTTRILNDATL
ncbi:MAG: WD40/YVTN/BNR-like repeat-containing protein, partial [Acidimicrobiia bacterium]